MGACNFEEGRFAAAQRLVVPCQMRSSGIEARRGHGHDGGIVAPMAVSAGDARVIDLCHQIVLAHARLGLLQNGVMHMFDNAGGATHVLDLARGFHRTLPVNKAGAVDDPGLRQVLDQRHMGGGGIVVVVGLDPQARGFSAQLLDQLCQFLHRVLFGVLHKGVIIADDVVGGHEYGPFRPRRIHRAAPPHGVARQSQNDRLMHIERPSVIAGQPRHVRRIGDHDHVKAAPVHFGAGQGDAALVFFCGKVCLECGHGSRSFD